jgi:NADH-ubiquinone oxidoreductase chain 6
MGITLIVQTIIIAVFSGMLLPSFWYSYILVLVFLGGLLILFIYVSTMAANEQIGAIPITFIALTLAFIFSLMNLRVKFVPRNIFSNNDNIIFKENYA